MAVSRGSRSQHRGAVAVFVARGLGAGRTSAELRADPGVRVVDSPRHAEVLVAIGDFPGELTGALDRVHDQLAHRRGSVWWRPAEVTVVPTSMVDAVVVHRLADIVTAAHEVTRRCAADATSSPDAAADVPPHPFEGRGDHGQGGEGMMGGVPFGRPMAMTGPDRDGLELDTLDVAYGPFAACFAPAVVIDAQLHGDVVHQVSLNVLGGRLVQPLEELDEPSGGRTAPVGSLSGRRRGDVRRRLRTLSDLCWVGGVPALATRAAALGAAVDDVRVVDIDRLATSLRRSGALWWWRDVGRGVDGGPGGDVATVAEELLAACRADLADDHADGDTPVVAAHRRCSTGEVAASLVGVAWGDAMLVIASIDGWVGSAGEPGAHGA